MTPIENLLPIYPERSLTSKAVLYRPLQDIDVYVEDEGSEVFYTELLKRIIDEDARIATVIPLRSRLNVLSQASSYSDPRPALFLIDGDLYRLNGLVLPAYPNLFVHPCYCIENYLFCENAMIQIVVEDNGKLKESDAKIELDWKTFRDRTEELLVPLFIEYAVSFELCPDIKTVALGVGKLLHQPKRGMPYLDETKVAAVRQKVKNGVIERVGAAIYESQRSSIAKRVKLFPEQLDAVSGKDYLIPLQIFKANSIGGQPIKRESFIFRLARHCSVERFDELRQKITEVLETNTLGSPI